MVMQSAGCLLVMLLLVPFPCFGQLGDVDDLPVMKGAGGEGIELVNPEPSGELPPGAIQDKIRIPSAAAAAGGDQVQPAMVPKTNVPYAKEMLIRNPVLMDRGLMFQSMGNISNSGAPINGSDPGPAGKTQTPGKEEDEGDSTWIIVGVVAALLLLVIIAVVVFFLIRKKQKAKGAVNVLAADPAAGAGGAGAPASA